MKIEKINDNQIRCTLTREDLITRKLKLSELAYGTDKAKSLFRDMMQQAANEFGFEANDIPLMIEAIPVSADSIILIITKVEDPEELDTRFAKFAPGSGEDSEDSPDISPLKLEGADDILNLFKKIQDAKKAVAGKVSDAKTPEPEVEEDETAFVLKRLFRFRSLDSIITASSVLSANYSGENCIFKDPDTKDYYLIISKSEHTPEEFNKICNILSEYGVSLKYTAAIEAFFSEHMEVILSEDALQKLSSLV